MMDKHLVDLYTDYLLASFGATTATGRARLMEGTLSHDQITRFLAKRQFTSADLWLLVKPTLRQIQHPDGVLIIDDTIEEKPYTDESELICWHFDHSKDRTVKGINFVSTLSAVNDVALPVAAALVTKTETVIDKKTGKEKKKSAVSKNEHYRSMLRACVKNPIPFRYVRNDIWFAAADNMKLIKNELHKDFVMPLKSNRKVALCREEQQQGTYQAVGTLVLEPGDVREVWLEGVDFALVLVKQVFRNGDGSTGILYLVTSDTTLDFEQITTLYQKRWKVEEYHKSLKSNLALANSPTRTTVTQTNHLFCSLFAFVKLELLRVTTTTNHFALKTKLDMAALRTAFEHLQLLEPHRFRQTAA
jgi:DDE superfamily endonuclease